MADAWSGVYLDFNFVVRPPPPPLSPGEGVMVKEGGGRGLAHKVQGPLRIDPILYRPI